MRILMVTDTRLQAQRAVLRFVRAARDALPQCENSLDGALFDSDIAQPSYSDRWGSAEKPSVHLQPSEGDVLRSLLIAMQNDPKLELTHILIDAGHSARSTPFRGGNAPGASRPAPLFSGADLSQWQRQNARPIPDGVWYRLLRRGAHPAHYAASPHGGAGHTRAGRITRRMRLLHTRSTRCSPR
jgi:hypothetical protein